MGSPFVFHRGDAFRPTASNRPSCQTLAVEDHQARSHRVDRNANASGARDSNLASLHPQQSPVPSVLPRCFEPPPNERPPPLPTYGHRALAASESREGCPSRQLAGSEPMVAPGRRQRASNSLLESAALRHTPRMNTNASGLVLRKAFANPRTLRSVFSQVFAAKQGQSTPPLPTPNPLHERIG